MGGEYLTLPTRLGVLASRRTNTSRRKANRFSLTVLVLATTLLSPLASSSNVSDTQGQLRRPNILFLIDESTDGRTYRPSFEAIDLINIRRLFARNSSEERENEAATENVGHSTGATKYPIAVQFDTHYVTAPVCAASRASIWSGKYPHRIPHLQANTGMKVNGVWNNFEGLPHDYSDKIHNVLERAGGYDIEISGKTDWIAVGHSLSNRLMAWTMYTRFPYNTTNHQAGFYNEYGMCTSNGTVHPKPYPTKGGYYSQDWKGVNKTTAWIRARGMEQASALKDGKSAKPFFAYQGMNIVHPAYVTTSYWYNKVNHSAVTAPAWKDLKDLHPCDYQSTMLKGCLPLNISEVPLVYSMERRKRIRAIYYAMILEFDSMVGAYLDTLESVPGLAENTIVIVTSDHGDMQMEHQQFYKHVAYDASSRVPLIVKIPLNFQPNNHKNNDDESFLEVKPFVTQPTSHIDLFPTIMDLAGIPQSLRPKELHGESLLPFLVPAKSSTLPLLSTNQNATAGRDTPKSMTVPRKRPFAVNQFHGADIAMSWFSIIDENHFKYTVFGTGDRHVSQLFDLKKDPDETTNLATNSSYELTIRRLDSLLLSVVNYKQVALDVAEYTHSSLGAWINSTSNWKSIVRNMRWRGAFDEDVNASIKAIETYLEGPPTLYNCRSEHVWPPPQASMMNVTVS